MSQHINGLTGNDVFYNEQIVIYNHLFKNVWEAKYHIEKLWSRLSSDEQNDYRRIAVNHNNRHQPIRNLPLPIRNLPLPIHILPPPKLIIHPSDTKAPEGLSDEFICISCNENLRKGTFVNCGHHIVCVKCGDYLMTTKKPCPECRAVGLVEYHY